MLDLGHNALEYIPETICELNQLDSYLYLHHNKLNVLPDTLD